MGSPSPASPVTQTTQISQMDPRLYQWLYGTANSPGRQQIANASMLAKTMQGVQNADPMALAAYYNVPKGTDLSQFQSHVGAMNPGQADPSLMLFKDRAVTPQDYYKQATAGEKATAKEAAKGGRLDGYKKGGSPSQPTADLNDYGLTPSQQKQFDKYETMRNSGKKFTPKQIKDYNAIKDTRTQYAQANPPKPGAGKTDLSLRDAQVGVTPFFDPESMTSTNPYYNQAVDVLKGMGQMPSQYGQAGDAYSNLQRMANYSPTSINAKDLNVSAAQMSPYERVAATKADTTGYNAALMSSPEAAPVKDYQAAQMSAAEMQRARDVNAPTAQAYTYDASQMRAPTDVKAGDYEAAQAQAAQMAPVRDVTGQTYSAANISPTQREQAQQIGDIGTINGQGYQAATMAPTRRERAATTAAPKSWTDPGVASQYMNPYAQSVIDQSVYEANRNFQKNLSALRGQAAKSKAYGGSRQGLEESEALRNQGYLIEDIQNKGLSQAYQQGMGQFQAEQGLGSQVGMSNTQAINALKSQYMQMGLSEAQANQAAINQAQQFTAAQGQSAQTQNVSNQLASQQANAQMVNALKSQYMSMGLSEAQANQAAQNQAAQFGAQSAQQASLANQQAGLTAGQANLSAAQQTAMANQAALNQQRQTAVSNALQAAMTNYGGQLTAAQQNMIADNAAKQFDAQNQSQISQANAQMNLTSQQSNQAADLTTNQANAQLSQQANAANQAAINQQRQTAVNNALQSAMQFYGGQLTAAQQNQISQNAAAQFDAQAKNQASSQFATQDLAAQQSNQQTGFNTAQQNAQFQQQANLANQQTGLTAGQANQQAGLSANQQNLSAMGQAGQGLLGVGQGVGSYNQNLMQNWGAAGNTLQNLAQGYYDKRQQSAQNLWGGVNTATQQATGTLLGSPFGTSMQGNYTTQRKKGGKLSIKV